MISVDYEKIPDRLYFRIGEVSKITGIKPYVLRYWESQFDIIAPTKSNNRRAYRKQDVETVLVVKKLLYEDRFSIEGAKKKLRELKKEEKELAVKQQKAIPSINKLKIEVRDLIKLIRIS